MSSAKVPISRLPLPSSANILTRNLTPDPAASSANALLEKIMTNPSTLRRSQASHPSAHFSYMTPLPLPFPYRIAPPPSGITNEQRSLYVEKVLAMQEPVTEAHSVPENPFKKYHSLSRDKYERELLSLAPTCLSDCFPSLDVGDALDVLGPSSLSQNPTPTQSTTSDNETSEAVRQELVDILSGDAVLMTFPSSPEDRGYAPWSLRYSGHQFGSWAGQLGDGRAISILEVPHPDKPNTTYELQLKGAGRTPFSRGADGLAVLRSSVREYLCAEAMHALGIPTTRSLSLISIPTLPVVREKVETAAIVCRVAPSFIRIGNFQALNSTMPDMTFMFLGGYGGANAQQSPDFEALRILGEWVSRRVLDLGLDEGEPWGKKLVWECARRNAIMVAGWQQMGFMHGVMNTDNISIMGLTIDYGPYAFMDVFDENHICNHTDEGGRYAYKFQPTMIIYALRMLLKSLAPVIGAEMESGKAIVTGWADSEAKIALWSDDGEKLTEELESYIMEVYSGEYYRLMRQRLGLMTEQATDHAELIKPVLDLMQKHKMDFHSTFRHLTTFRASWILDPQGADSDGPLHTFLKVLLPSDEAATNGTKDWLDYLGHFAARINSEEEQNEWKKLAASSESSDGWESVRETYIKRHNPRFVLRQWNLEEVIASLVADAEAISKGETRVGGGSPSKGRQVLNKVLEMATRPFESWGAEGREPKTEEEKEEARFCGTGPKQFLGFQCSCSS
ncbi:hypothetical protein FRB94_002261 [Tulasnella sp. JGI-2019a]|nr:hypothetical protein FRB94_002261 [Tulasnella sp. JGI-2019a]